MATATFTPLKRDPALQNLMKEAQEHEAFIAQIKQEVSKEADNLNNPTPTLFQQMQPVS